MELLAALDPHPQEVARARKILTGVLDEWGWSGDTAHTAVLLTSELVTNAVRHGSGPIELCAGITSPDRLRVEVRDGRANGVRVRDVGPEDEDGRGLQLVTVLAADWGWRRDAFGKRVWFELTLTSAVGMRD